MVVVEQKPIKEILQKIGNFEEVAVVGCRTCAAVCLQGGEQQVEIFSTLLNISARQQGKKLHITSAVIERQCEYEFVKETQLSVDVVITLGCGAGAQVIADVFSGLLIIPGVNTKFIGVVREYGEWEGYCAACGSCQLDKFGGICVVTRCPKVQLNGPCGGSNENGRCELKNRECAWQLIYKRLKEQNRLQLLSDEIISPKEWQYTSSLSIYRHQKLSI